MSELDQKLLDWLGLPNIKIAEWRGVFRNMKYKVETYVLEVEDDDGEIDVWMLFTNSTDSCSKWLVPKLNDKGIYVCLDQFIDGSGWSVMLTPLDYSKKDVHSEDDNPALALCKAIEQMEGL